VDISTLIFLATALSLDAASAGFAYGLRKIKIPLPSYAVLLFVSMVIVGISVLCGSAVAELLPEVWGERLGGLILIGIGLFWLIKPRSRDRKDAGEGEKVKKIAELRLASLAIIIQICEEPVSADLDASGEISIKESLLLAFALSLDALGAVFGAAMAGCGGIQAVLLIGLFQQCFLLLGVKLGGLSSCSWLRSQGQLLSGALLCLMGLIKLI